VKQLLIISGKGGTGKTVLTAAFAALAGNKVMVDCDVDAADLHLLLDPKIKEAHIFKSGLTAVVDRSQCTQCGTCREVCRFDAVNSDFTIDQLSCEGCAFCSFACPEGAIEMIETVSGEWFISETRFGPMVHAKLGVAKENSGKLVSLVKQKAKEIAKEYNFDQIIIDGAPGIGCPVIASLSGVSFALIVTEPSISGLHDAVRVMDVAQHFDVPAKVIINKYDLNSEMTDKIEKYCRNRGIQILGRIGFDESVVHAMVEGKTIVEYRNGKIKKSIEELWSKISEELEKIPG
jgi:MinD superfamily P-loop ATPase